MGVTPHPDHSVYEYESDPALAEAVAHLIERTVRTNQPFLLICCLSLQQAILQRMSELGIDTERLRLDSSLEILDSGAVLGELLQGELPDADRFNTKIPALLKHLCAGRERCIPAIYADMGDVLVRAGNAPAAVSLEILWNLLAARGQVFSLVCGYAAAHHHQPVPSWQELQAICEQHTLGPARAN